MHRSFAPAIRFSLRAFFCALVTALALPCSAAPYITLGPSDGVALDQPRVTVDIVDPVTQKELGPEFSSSFLLDTGANDILVGGNAYGELRDNGYQTVAQYDDYGVGGTATMDVSKAYDFYFAGDNGQPFLLPNTRLLSNAEADVGFDGVAGMPLMVNRTVGLDMSVWSGGNFDLMTTTFTNAAPPVTTHQYHVPLTLQDFPPTGQHNPGDPLPTFGPLCTAPVQMVNDGRQLNGQFIVDTGAQISIISTATARALGIDPERDAVDALDLSGIAGTVTVPIVDVSSLALKTTEGVNLMWTDLQVGVYDVDPSIAGVFGMDFLTSGWLGALFGGPDGYFDKAYFDFRNAAAHVGTLTLNLNPALDHVALPGDANGDLLVNAADISIVASHWLQSGTSVAGDVNGDGIVNAADMSMIASNWLSSYRPAHSGVVSSDSVAAVPEPATLWLGLFAGLGGLVATQRLGRRRPTDVTPRHAV